MSRTLAENEPQLQPPGAGLPKPELFIARMLFTLRRCSGNRESFNTDFQKERAAIRSLLGKCDERSGARRVLIRRPVGMEDSSRYWSVWMTLDHLRIIHQQIASVINILGEGKVPGWTASTAAVKPSPDANATVVPGYEKSCDDLLGAVAAIPNLRTKVRFAHPWFGPLDAAGWHALAGMHLSIHRRQIERILEGVSNR